MQQTAQNDIRSTTRTAKGVAERGALTQLTQKKARRAKRPPNPLLADRAALTRVLLDTLRKHAPIGKTALSRLLDVGLHVITEQLDVLEAEGQAERFRRSGRRGRLDEFWQVKGHGDVNGQTPARPRRLSSGLSPAETLDAFQRAARRQINGQFVGSGHVGGQEAHHDARHANSES
jgi:predicted ArsR family transcriptional regulator